MTQTFQPHGLDFEIIAGSPAAKAEAHKIVAEIKTADRGEAMAVNSTDTDTPAVKNGGRQAFDSSKGMQLVGMNSRSEAALIASGVYDIPNVSNKAEFGSHTTAVVASRIPNVSSKAANNGMSF